MFKVLQAHEEREPKAVLKTQSKRAQKRLTRQEARREEADRLNAASNNGNSQFGGADTRRPSSSLSADDVKEQQQIALHMYEELFSQGDVDPGLCDDIAAQLGRMHLPPAGPAAAACAAGGGSDWGSGHEEAAASLASTRTAELANLRRRVDSPPGPGPGSGFESPWPEPKPNPGGLAGKWLTRKGSAPPLFWPDPPSSSGSPRAAGAASTSASRSRGAGSILLRFGSGASFGAEGAAAASCAAAAAAGGGGGGQLGESHGSPAAPAQLFTRDSFQQLRGRAAGSEAEVEEFPELQATVSAEQPPPPPQGKQQQPQRQQGQQGQHLSHAHRRGPGGGGSSGRHAGRCQGGVKVLHRSSNGRSQPLCNGGSRGGGGGGGGGDDESATGFSLSLLWDLIQGGLCLRGDPLAAEGGDLRGPEPDVAVAIKRLVRARCPEEPDDAPARGVSPEDMIAMMARAHKRQCKKARGGGGGAAAAPAVHGGGCSSSDDEPHLYLNRDESKSWRRTEKWMEENDWVLVKDTDGKHRKYRRWLPNGQIQTQTVCCSPSDAMRGIRNLQADLARKDAQANPVIRAWRREERERRRRESAAAAAAVLQGGL